MDVLSQREMNSVGGGSPVITIGYGIGAGYLYEVMGGRQGIDNYFANSFASENSSISYWQRRVQRIVRSQESDDERRENP